MKWTTSQVIAALAVLSPILTAWINSHFKLTGSKLSIKQDKMKRRNERLDEIESAFHDYVEITYLELNDLTRKKFSVEQKKAESKVLIHASNDLYAAISHMHSIMEQQPYEGLRVKELRNVISTFNQQFSELEQVPSWRSKILGKIKSFSHRIKEKLPGHK